MEHGPPAAGAAKALVIEDESRLRRALCGALEDWGFAIRHAAGGTEGLQTWQADQPDLVLLDLGLPDVDGLDVLQRARRLGLDSVVLVLTARATVGDCLLGLNFGADGYLTKPFDWDELRARIAAMLRRRGAAGLPVHSPAEERPLRLGKLAWEPGFAAFHCDGESVILSQRECFLLRALLQRPNQARTREDLLGVVFAGLPVRSDALEVVAFRLRRKLARCGVCVVTLRGLGYLIKESPR